MKRLTIIACALLVLACLAQAQTTNLSVVIPAEASLTVNGTGTTNLATTGTNFTVPYTGTTNLTYMIRTSKTSGTGSITLKVTTDFGPAGGPSVGTPPTTGDALTYTCTAAAGTICTANTAASTGATATPVVTFGAGVTTVKAGAAASTAWSLTDDPLYAAGTYTATVTYYIAAN
jgi:hypothetical protein